MGPSLPDSDFGYQPAITTEGSWGYVAIAMDIDRGACDCRDCRRHHHKSIPAHSDCRGDPYLRPRHARRQHYPLLGQLVGGTSFRLRARVVAEGPATALL